MLIGPLLEDDVQRERNEARIIPTPLCDEEHDLAEAAPEPDDQASGDEHVEAHGGGGFNDAA